MASFSPISFTAFVRLLAGFRLNAHIKPTSIHLLMCLAMFKVASASVIANRGIPDYSTAEAGNPFVQGWYADPDTEIYDGLYWVYPTSSLPYDNQTYFDAFSSPDLVTWTKYPNILTTANVTWATRAVWAPAPISKNGKYYLYFGANDIQEGEPEQGKIGGIGVAVADKPEGPYVDAIGKPLIGEYHNGAQPIDQDVFIDDVDGQAYIYYGGHSHANVAKINEDMISIGTFDDGTQYKEITPENYVEGPQMIKRNGTYYLQWSEGDWTGPDYSVSYAMSDSPLGPFKKVAKILEQDSTVAKGSGHNGVFQVPGTDIWYIVYHRRPLSETDGNHRVLAYDRMYFNDNGTIAPVKMLVKDNFANGEMFDWKTYNGTWSVVDQRLSVASTPGARAMLDTAFEDMVFDATVAITDGSGDAGLVFRVSESSDGADKFQGYYAGISQNGTVSLGKASDGNWETLSEGSAQVSYATEYQFRVTANGSDFSVFVGDMKSAKVNATDDSFTSGSTGVGVRSASAKFGYVSVSEFGVEPTNASSRPQPKRSFYYSILGSVAFGLL
ncbi:carbohydrate-binding module family 66 protein [Jackrogersella minutella]|nr:carbohydrate-binding module family 66 protein [Jackrogersella minutella]